MGVRRLPARIHQIVEDFLIEVISWPDVDARIGTSQQNHDGMANAIRLHCRGTATGAFVYLRVPSGNMLVRLPPNWDTTELKHVNARKVSPSAPYGLAIRLESKEALEEAIQLARTAYERAIVTSPMNQKRREKLAQTDLS
jgi:hypothetical protein